MTNKKTTRRALITSIISLLLCVSMLVGTTFAWFTDSVTSGKNQIVAGNLDIELEYAVLNTDGTVKEWKTVNGATNLFTGNLWEPGHTEVVYLKLSNLGTLALKYNFGINIVSETAGINVAGESFKLSDHIRMGVVENAQPAYGSREDAIAAAQNGANGIIGEGYTKSGTMTAGQDALYLAVVVYMPEEVGNEANYKTGTAAPTINLGLNLVATQLTYEEDSFGPDYDTDSTYPISVNASVPAGSTVATPIEVGDVTVFVPAGAAAGEYTLEVTNKQIATDADGKTTVTFDINLYKDGAKVAADGTTKYPVKINVGVNKDVSAVTHNGAAVDSFHYEPTTGIVSFETDSFSPFAVTYTEANEDSVFVPENPEAAEKLEKAEVVAVDENGNEYTTITDAVKSGASKLYFKEGADLGTVTHLDVANDLTIYGNGAYISGGEHDLAIDTYVMLDKDITVNIYNLHGIAVWGQRNTEYTANINLYNCNNINRIFISGTAGTNNINLVNCTADKAAGSYNCSVYSNTNGKIVVDGCTFTDIDCPVNFNHKESGEQTVIVKNSKFIDCATAGTEAYFAPIRLYNSAEGAYQTLTVEGNTFTYSEGKAPVNGADVLLNAKHNGADATGSIVANVQADASTAKGVNVTLTHTVSNKAELYAVAAFVNQYSNYEHPYAGETVLLLTDIDLGGEEWTPIGDYRFSANRFCGTFDGNRKTISNFKITKKTDKNDDSKSAYGFFGNLSAVVKDLTLDNVNIDLKGKFVGVLAGRFNTCTCNDNVAVIENCKVTNSTVKASSWTVGGLVGQWNGGKISGCTVEETTVKGLAAVGSIAGIALNSGDRLMENCTAKNCSIVQTEEYGGNFDLMFGTILGATYSSTLNVSLNNCVAENTTVTTVNNTVPADAICGFVAEGDILLIDGKRTVNVATVEELTAALADNTVVVITADIADASVKMPATLKNVTITAKSGVAIKNSTIMAADGNSISYEGLTFDGLTFENSRITITGWRTGGASVKDLTVTNCVFKNLDDTTNSAPLHINMAQTEPVNGFTFTDNVIDGATGGSKSGVYAQVTGKVLFTGNVINNVSFRPYVIQVTTDDGIADEFIVTGNTFSGSASGRAQGLGNNSEGTDTVKLVVSGNIFKGITSAQQICYWNFNPEKTTADLSKNYYDIDIAANPDRIYYNAAATSVADLVNMGVYPYYTELNADGTINTASLKTEP